jgi:crotonobetainyl-CoA:carnitine CoA-transferase CaiB-like acyl-CoA transferase
LSKSRPADDPVNRQLGRVVSFRVPEWRRFEQIGPPVHSGPRSRGSRDPLIPGIGEHTREVLAELHFTTSEIDYLVTTSVERQQ